MHDEQVTEAFQPGLSPRPEAVFRVTVLDGVDAGASVTIDAGRRWDRSGEAHTPGSSRRGPPPRR